MPCETWHKSPAERAFSSGTPWTIQGMAQNFPSCDRDQPMLRPPAAPCYMLRSVEMPENVEAEYPLSRLTTVRAGGPADLFARPSNEAELVEVLRWAREEGVQVGVVGSGSNLLISDDGYRGLVLKLDGELSSVERNGTHVLCGGGARLPSATAK